MKKSFYEIEVDPSKRELGTDSLVKTYTNDTPGQIKEIIKKTIRKKYEKTKR